jgi:hypothetical protein
MRTRPLTQLFVGLLAAAAAFGSAAAECSARSGPQRTALVELYTSEGCSSCPPADRWLSGLRAAGIGPQAAVPLAFHVDYWNKLGWPDRFSQADFSDRQRTASRRNRLDFVYTPQFIVDGRDFRSPGGHDALKQQLAQAGRERAWIELTATAHAARLEIAATVGLVAGERSRLPELFVAVAEDGLWTQVTAGENMGRQLRHDAVVRTLVGPMTVAPDIPAKREQSIPLAADWNPARLTVVAFVQDRATGDVLQALALPVCR